MQAVSPTCTVVSMATKHQCAGGCGLSCPSRPARTTPQVVGERKVNAKAFGLPGRWATVQVLPASNRGRNARSTTGRLRGWGGSQPKGAKPAKKQNTHIKGAQPRIAATRWNYV